MSFRGTLINPYRFHGDKRALNRKLSGREVYPSVASEQQSSGNSGEWNRSPFVSAIVVPMESSTHEERLSCRSPRRRRVTIRSLAYKLGRTLRKVIKEFRR
jgi:hypothetical protein